MTLFNAPPRHLLRNLCLAIAASAVVVSSAWAALSLDLNDPGMGSAVLTVAAMLVPVAGVGIVVLLLYAYPVLLLLRRLGRAGPASTFLVALAPAMLFSVVPEMRELAFVLAAYGAVAAGVFVVCAYPRRAG
jgi:hypothetical protein